MDKVSRGEVAAQLHWVVVLEEQVEDAVVLHHAVWVVLPVALGAWVVPEAPNLEIRPQRRIASTNLRKSASNRMGGRAAREKKRGKNNNMDRCFARQSRTSTATPAHLHRAALPLPAGLGGAAGVVHHELARALRSVRARLICRGHAGTTGRAW